MTEYLIFTDNWWNWFLHTYSFTIGLGWALLKALAILDPSNKTNTILDSFRSFLPGGKELARRGTDKEQQKESEQ